MICKHCNKHCNKHSKLVNTNKEQGEGIFSHVEIDTGPIHRDYIEIAKQEEIRRIKYAEHEQAYNLNKQHDKTKT